MRQKTRVQHWRYEDGWRDIPYMLRKFHNGEDKEFSEYITGWHCWVYANNDEDFEGWMRDNMRGEYECDLRFNSGDPMYTVLIKDNEDATLFKLRWM